VQVSLGVDHDLLLDLHGRQLDRLLQHLLEFRLPDHDQGASAVVENLPDLPPLWVTAYLVGKGCCLTPLGRGRPVPQLVLAPVTSRWKKR
jgi:hypothetical protein